MAKLAELGLSNDQIEGIDTFENLPEQRGTFQPPPAPGDYTFELPPSAKLADAFEPITAQVGQRINLVLNEDAPLKILSSPGGTRDGEPFQTRISNVERKRNKDGTVVASDMDYLLQATGATGGRPRTNKQYGDAIVKQGGKRFAATVEWSWSCNDKRAARFAQYDEATQQTSYTEQEDASVEGGKTRGCGARYYQTQVAKDAEGNFPLHITCTACGADVRAFANLTRFRKVG